MPNGDVSLRDLLAAPYLYSDRTVEFQRAPAGRGLRRPLTVARAYLRSQLVDEDNRRLALRDG